MTPKNAELAYRVLDAIDADPKSWNQSCWISRPDGADCGTAACFAGWACILSGATPRWEYTDDERTGEVYSGGATHLVGSLAQDLLGISWDDRLDLFHEDNTREELQSWVEKLFGPRPGGAA